MAGSQNIVHQYYKKEMSGSKILVMVNPHTFEGKEITVLEGGSTEMRALTFDEAIFDDLAVDGFVQASPIEFHLYLSGLIAP